MSNERSNGLLGFLAGAAVGATLGVLFAPRSGKETREQITNKAGALKDELDEFIDRARGEWAKASGKASDAATMTKDEVNDFVRFLFEEGKDLKDRLARDMKKAGEATAQHAADAAERVRQHTS